MRVEVNPELAADLLFLQHSWFGELRIGGDVGLLPLLERLLLRLGLVLILEVCGLVIAALVIVRLCLLCLFLLDEKPLFLGVEETADTVAADFIVFLHS